MSLIIHHKNCIVCGNENLPTALELKDYSISKEDFSLAKCSNCQFVFTQDIPDETSIGPYYQSEAYISHSNTKKGLINSLYHIVRNWMLMSKRTLISRLSPNKRILDVGSGTGYFLDFMKKSDYEVLGVEVDEAARTFAADNFGLTIHSPSKLLSNGIEEKFGAITMWHVLEHVHDPDAYFQAYQNLLSENGILAIAVPNCDSYDAAHYKKHWAAYDVPRHLWHFTPPTIKKLAAKNGFDLIEKKRLPYDAFYCSLLSEKYKGNSLYFISGFLHGGISWLKSIFDIDKTSSLVYVFKKTPSAP